MEALESIEHEGYLIEIFQDPDPESPREWDNLGEMICWHRRYQLGDKHDYRQPSDFEATVAKGDIVLPLWLYDHGAVTMSCGDRVYPFTDLWDAGQVGYIVARAETIRKEYSVKRISKQVREKAIAVLRGEVNVYDDFLRGAVYGFEITKKCPTCGGKGELVDSCWSYYGREDCIAEARVACPDIAA